ncbi:hypothetical protein INR49_031516, partial [Caranx melampygus]
MHLTLSARFSAKFVFRSSSPTSHERDMKRSYPSGAEKKKQGNEKEEKRKNDSGAVSLSPAPSAQNLKLINSTPYSSKSNTLPFSLSQFTPSPS